MKIERLRLSGFKSFVENTEFSVDSGLTGFVGPNGCGKSNILEALRWIMGATSAKALRGKGMEDVIFAGTSNRPARNTAEVTIFLDNADRKAPAAFNDSDKLEVIRRIERDAGSAYKINGKDVRARDVQLLFADASTGSNSPALVKQGQISELINAKPENRRRLLEEAAGIAGLHSRRHEAELRLRAAENNLLRLDDVREQIEEQLSRLKRQARQASRYRNLSGHIRKAEAIGLHLRWTQAHNALSNAEAELDDAEKQVERHTRKAAAAAKAQAEVSAALPPLREAESEAAAKLQRLNVERETLDREEARARDHAQDLEARLKQIAQDIRRERKIHADAEQMITKLDKEMIELEQRNTRQNVNLEALEQTVGAAQKELAEREKELDRLTEQAASSNAQRSTLGRTLEEKTSRIGALEAQLASTIEERESLLDGSPHLETKETALARVKQTHEAAEAAEETAQRANKERAAAAAEETAVRQPFQDAESALNKLEAETEVLKELLGADNERFPPIMNSVSIQPGYELAVFAAFGDDLDASTDISAPVRWETLEGRPKGMQMLPQGAQGLNDFVTAPENLKRRLAQVGLVDRAQGGKLQAGLAAGQRLVSREGDLWRWDGYTQSAEASGVSTNLKRRKRLTELERDMESAAHAHDETREKWEAAAQLVSERTRHEDACRARWRDAQQNLSAARDRLSAAEKAATEITTRLATLDEAQKRLEDDIEESRRHAQSAEAELDRLKSRAPLEVDVDTLRETVTRSRVELSEARTNYEINQREADLRAKQLRETTTQIQEWRSRMTGATEQAANLEQRREQIDKELDAVRQVPGEVEQRRGQLLDAVREAEESRSAAADVLAEAETRLAACDSDVKDAQRALGEAREGRARAEALLEGAKDRRDEVLDRIKDSLDCRPEDLLEKGGVKESETLPTLEEIDIKLERFKRERENMGAVNLRADEEAREQRERLEEMGIEREDLEGAISKLRSGIASLNREGRERLLAAFDRVNGHFSHLFTVLFDGGTAKLELTESDDPLSAGLDVFARPPGKRLQNMSLLSGGEQALTAIALIFAVFLSNPAPICFLDEVDAPLDDANVERFCNLLDEMTKSTDTPFIIITHHALTMSRMNRLYGVTMTERGISQLVSVDLTGTQQIQAAE